MPRRAIVSEQLAHELHHLRREALGRLVDHDEVGIAHQRAADRQHLLLAARQHAAGRVGALAQQRKERKRVLATSGRPVPVGPFMPRSRFSRTVRSGKIARSSGT